MHRKDPRTRGGGRRTRAASMSDVASATEITGRDTAPAGNPAASLMRKLSSQVRRLRLTVLGLFVWLGR